MEMPFEIELHLHKEKILIYLKNVSNRFIYQNFQLSNSCFFSFQVCVSQATTNKCVSNKSNKFIYFFDLTISIRNLLLIIIVKC